MRKQSTLSSLLKPEQIEFIEQEKHMFDKMYKNFSKLGASTDIMNLIADSKSKIDDLFMVYYLYSSFFIDISSDY